MGVTTTKTNKPLNPRGNDQSPLAFNRAKLYSGKALDFDGVNDKVDLPTLSFDLYAFSFYYEGEINSGTGQFVFNIKDSSNDGVSIGSVTSLLTGETLTIGNNGNYTAITESFDDAIHFIVCTWNATESKYDFYLNAQKLTTTNSGADAALYSITTAPAIGYRKVFNDMYLNGKVSNVRAFSTALTAAQVADLYNNPEKVVPTGVDNTALKLWLPMMEGAGTTAYDGSGNGNHGTISGATYVNGVGSPVAQSAVMDWNKGSNNQTYSEQANNAQWTQENLTISNNVETAPNGTLTADKMVASAVNTFHFSGQAQSLPNAKNYTASIYAKAAEYEHLYICLRTDTNSKRYGVKFDLTNGTFVDDAGLGSPTNTGYNITSVGDGWYRCEVTSYHTSGDVNGLYGPSPGGAVNGINNTFTGNGTNGIYIWGAQVNEGTTATIYVPTIGTLQPTPVLLPQGLTTGRDITGVNLFENVRKQGALNLDGNSWAEVHDNGSLDITSAISVECWVNVTDGTANKMLISKWSPYADDQRSYLLYLTDGEYLRFSISSDGQNSHTVSSSQRHFGGWKHFVATYDKTTLRLYVNGAAENTAAQTADINVGTFQVEIGRHQGDTSAISSDNIAQPRIYNRALTAEEVQRNYNAGKNTYTN